MIIHRTAPHRTAPRSAPHRTAPHRTAPHRTAPHRTAPHRNAPHRTAPHRTGQILQPMYPLRTSDYVPGTEMVCNGALWSGSIGSGLHPTAFPNIVRSVPRRTACAEPAPPSAIHSGAFVNTTPSMKRERELT